jgi:hypothetical protein
MVFDINKIPIKYIIGSYIDDPLYPSPNDVIYLMTKRSADKNKDLDPVTFTESYIFKKIEERYHDNLNVSINSLLNEGHIEVNRETKTGKTYKIINNPFL